MKKILKNQEGMALSFVVMTLLVVYIMASIVASIAQANIKQADAQDKGLQAYYTARSGAELAFEALWEDSGARTLLGSLKEDGKSGSLVTRPTQTINLPDDMGTASVDLSYKKTGNDEIIEIKSTGNYKNIKRNVLLKVYLEVDSSDTNNSILKEIVWSK